MVGGAGAGVQRQVGGHQPLPLAAVGPGVGLVEGLLLLLQAPHLPALPDDGGGAGDGPGAALPLPALLCQGDQPAAGGAGALLQGRPAGARHWVVQLPRQQATLYQAMLYLC